MQIEFLYNRDCGQGMGFPTWVPVSMSELDMFILCNSGQASSWVSYPNHRTKRIAQDKKGHSQESFDVADMKLLPNTRKPSSVDSGPNVHRSGQEADLERDKYFLGSGPFPRVVRIILCPLDQTLIVAFLDVALRVSDIRSRRRLGVV